MRTAPASASTAIAAVLFASACAAGDPSQAPAADAPASACIAPKTSCGGACVDTTSDFDHCGACGATCAPGEVCSRGRCAAWCAAGAVACGGACVSLSTDRDHCGACGAACAIDEQCVAGTCVGACGPGCGGTCVSGRCETVIADGLSLYWLATDGVNLYAPNYDGGWRIQAFPIAGGPSWTIVESLHGPAYLATDGTNVYWDDSVDHALYQASIRGGAITTLATEIASVGHVALGGGRVFVADANDGAIWSAQAGVSGSGRKIVTGQPGAFAIVADAQNLYWTASGTQSVMQSTLAGSDVRTIATGVSAAWAIAVDAQSVYWASSQDATIAKVPVGGGAVVTIASALGEAAQWLASDGTSVYYSQRSTGRVTRVPVTGASAPTLVGTVSGAGAIAVDATSVYAGYTSLVRITPK